MSAKKVILLPAILLLFLIAIIMVVSKPQAISAQNEPAFTTEASSDYFLPLVHGYQQSFYVPEYSCDFELLADGPRTYNSVVTTMADGQIFISGGQEIINKQKIITTRTYIFNPGNRQFKAVGFSNLANHNNATLLPDGRVIMFAGGPINQGRPVQLPEIYDPKTESFSNGGTNVECIDAPYAFSDGDVLLICSYDESAIDSFAQIYDPVLDDVQTFEAATFGSFTGPYPLAFAIPYEKDKALVTDGFSAAVFDKESSSDIPISGLVVDGEIICGHPNAAIGLSADQKKVYEAGGFDDSNVFPEEYYAAACVVDLDKFAKKQLPDMQLARYGHSWVGLSDGDMVVIGGRAEAGVTGSIELLAAHSDTWHPAGELNVPRTNFAAILLTSGEILIYGGLAADSDEIPPPEIGRCQRNG